MFSILVLFARTLLLLATLIFLTFCIARYVSISAKFGICTILGLNGTIVEAKRLTWDIWMCVFLLQTNGKFSINWEETDNSVY